MQSITGLKVRSLFADLKTVYPQRQRPTGEVETFSAKVTQVAATETIPIDTEDLGAVLVHFDNDVRGVMWVSQLTAGRKNHLNFEIAGSQRALWFDGEKPNELWIGHRDRPNELLIKDPALMGDLARAYTGYPGGHAEGYPDSFKMLFKAFYDYIAAGDFAAPPPFPTLDEGHDEILLCEAILRSQETRGWVDVRS